MQRTVERISFLFSKNFMKSIKRFFRKGHCLLCPFLFLALGCVNKQPPIEEYNLARAAVMAAKDSEAKRYAPRVYSQAKRYMRKAERAFKDRYFEKSTGLFRKSRYYSEKAENISRVKMLKQGEGQ